MFLAKKYRSIFNIDFRKTIHIKGVCTLWKNFFQVFILKILKLGWYIIECFLLAICFVNKKSDKILKDFIDSFKAMNTKCCCSDEKKAKLKESKNYFQSNNESENALKLNYLVRLFSALLTWSGIIQNKS